MPVSFGWRSSRSLLASALGLVVLLAGCASSGVSSPDVGSPTDATPTALEEDCPRGAASSDDRSQPPGLESRLYDLVVADDHASHATAHDLRLRDGAAEVTIELREGTALPDGFDLSVETRHDTLVQAFVPICDLVPLSEHDNVSFVRSPLRPVPDEPSVDSSGP